jgi:hypothetical protein
MFLFTLFCHNSFRPFNNNVIVYLFNSIIIRNGIDSTTLLLFNTKLFLKEKRPSHHHQSDILFLFFVSFS